MQNARTAPTHVVQIARRLAAPRDARRLFVVGAVVAPVSGAMLLRIAHLHDVASRPLAWALAAALLASPSGCGVRGRAARETARYTYRTSCDAVVPAVREALRDRGFELQPPPDDSTLELTTEWRDPDPPRKNEHYPTRHRYVALLTARDASCRLQVHRETSRDEGVLRERDLDVEWAVLRQVDPAGARRIAADGASP